MSRETREWLSQNTLIGFTEKRGNAWHYRQGDDNHYTGAIPVDDVLRRLFPWSPVEVAEQWTFNGQLITGKDKVIVRSDTGAKLGTFTEGYRMHPYPEWLIENVGRLIDDEVQIGSAVLLKQGKIAAVQIEVPDNFETPEGVVFRPFLLATTSFDGSIATTYKRNFTAVVCDNTLDMGLSEKGQQIKIRHSRNSLDGKVAAAREALNLIHQAADDFSEQVANLCDLPVSEVVWENIVTELTKIEDDNPSKTALTLSGKKRDTLMGLWRSDERVTPWAGTAFGAFQALNTYRQHAATVRGATRPERNMMNTVLGVTGKEDRANLELIVALAA